MDRVNTTTQEVFNALGQLRAAGPAAQPIPDVLHARLKTFVERAMRNAVEAGFNQRDAHDIGYVLSALADEVVLSLGIDGVRDFWIPRLLQLQLFNENTAGDGVFLRIQSMLADSSRAEVLRVYYSALLFGFRGRYAIRGGEIELADVIERTAYALRQFGAMASPPLSPSAVAKAAKSKTGRRFPIVWISAVVLVLSLGLFGLLIYLGADQAKVVAEQLAADAPATE